MTTELNNITFIFDAEKWNCNISVKGGQEIPLKNKGNTNKNGQWYQLDENLHHWISFNYDKFNSSKIEAFYKRPVENDFKYYRQTFQDLEKGDSLIIFNFSQFDEWFKDTDGKWKSKFTASTNENKQPWKNHNDK